jgi:hypothetical protein
MELVIYDGAAGYVGHNPYHQMPIHLKHPRQLFHEEMCPKDPFKVIHKQAASTLALVSDH